MLANLKQKYIGDHRFYKMVLAIAIPIMIQNGITNFVSMLDNIMVGRVGTEQMTGVAIVNQIIFVFNLAVFGAVSGAGIFGAQFHGSGDDEGVRATFRFKLIITLALAMIGIAVFSTNSTELITLFLRGEGTAAEIAASLGYAKTYMSIMLWGFVPFVLVNCYSSTLRETGETMLPMKAGIASVAVNFCLNGLLIFGLFGFPRLGSAGAAIATVISRFVEAGIVILFSHKNRARLKFVNGLYSTLAIPKRLVIDIAKKGTPLLFNETLWSFGMAMLNQCYSLRSYDVVSAVNISSTISNAFGAAFMALGSAVGIIVGQLLGAGKKEEAIDTDRKLIFFSVVICFLTGGLMASASKLFPQIYNTTNEIRSLAASFILISSLCMPINAMANSLYFTLRCGGKTLITVLFDSCYACVVVVPLAYFLSRYTTMPIVPMYLCCQLSEIGKCILGSILVKRGIWINNIVENRYAAEPTAFTD